MMSEIVRVVPESLQSLVDDSYHKDVDEFAATSLEEFTRTMPEVELFSRYNDGVSAIMAAVYRPEEYDPTHAVFSLNPFGDGHQPHMDIRNRAAQRIAAPNSQVVSFPNNTASQTYYKLTPKQLFTVATGDATPLAESIHHAAEEMGLETLDLITYSQGTLLGVALLKVAQERGVLKINNMLIGEPTNVIDRTEKQLKKAFLGSGLFPLIRAVNDSGIPALVEAQAMRVPRDIVRFTESMRALRKGLKIPENRVLQSAMTHDDMAQMLTDIANNDGGRLHTRITLARAEKSEITPNSESYDYIARNIARQSVVIDGYGHEAAYNVTGAWALLAKFALQ